MVERELEVGSGPEERVRDTGSMPTGAGFTTGGGEHSGSEEVEEEVWEAEQGVVQVVQVVQVVKRISVVMKKSAEEIDAAYGLT